LWWIQPIIIHNELLRFCGFWNDIFVFDQEDARFALHGLMQEATLLGVSGFVFFGNTFLCCLCDCTISRHINFAICFLRCVLFSCLFFFPVVVLANKQDLKKAKSPEEWRTLLQLDKIKDRECMIMGTVAEKNQGIQEAFQWIFDHPPREVKHAPPSNLSQPA
jgi:hypothetical protein